MKIPKNLTRNFTEITRNEQNTQILHQILSSAWMGIS